MRLLKLKYVMPLLIPIIGCEDHLAPSYENRLVIQAYLYANEEVNDIILFETIPLEFPDSTGGIVTDAQVSLLKNDNRFELTFNDSIWKYEYSGEDLTVEAGDEIELRVFHMGLEAYATTVVPQSPENVSISADTIRIGDLFQRPGAGGQGNPAEEDPEEEDDIYLYWDNPAESYYFVIINNIEQEKVELFSPDMFPGLGDRFQGSGFRQLRKGQLISRPTTEDQYLISAQYFDYYGEHEVIVYKVNEEYAELYENQEQDSRDLTEPPSNIINGLGIFTSFNGVKMDLYLAKRKFRND